VPFLGGSAKQIVDRANTPVSWSPDGTHMTFIRPSGPGQELVVAGRNGEDVRVIASAGGGPARGGGFATNLPGATAVAPAWSPDGQRIAALQRLGEDVRDMALVVFDVSNDGRQVVNVRGDVPLGYGWLDPNTLVVVQALEQGTPSQLWRVTVPDGRRSRLTNDVNRYSDITFSSDGSTFVTARPETRVGLWVGDAKGEGNEIFAPTPFLSNAPVYAGIAWDGDQVVFTHTLNGHFEIFRTTAQGGGTPEPVAAGRDLTVGADGAIAFRSVTGDNMGLWRVDRDGRHPIELAKGTVNFPMSTPDGQQVVFSSPTGGPQSLWRVPMAGGAPPQLMKTSVSIYGYSDVSPDGRSIAMLYDGSWVICNFPDCTDRKPISFRAGIPNERWMPDGRGICYVDRGTDSGLTPNIFVQPIDGSAPRQLTHFTDRKTIGQYAWSRDGRRLAMSRATFSSDIVLFRGLKGRSPSQ
jgi:Tol biopolymer transport system component